MVLTPMTGCDDQSSFGLLNRCGPMHETRVDLLQRLGAIRSGAREAFRRMQPDSYRDEHQYKEALAKQQEVLYKT